MKSLLKTVSIVAIVVGISGCNAHNGSYVNNQTGGTLLGGIVGGVVGNHFGKGSGKTAATALGAVIGAMTGGNVGRSMDQPRIIYQNSPPVVYRHSSRLDRCASYPNEGVRAACNRGVAARNRARQHRMEREAFRFGRGYTKY